ncbi:glycosyltransferase family 2 protein [Vreelandella andesensis]|uniref:Glycosyltransferase family 2 protein n=1 Tax=Vreelandella andesensis TaxID=447567 RepID=A0A433KHY5_9GAMM|nr:glycosyltransferase family A protein [Halomonas andesensis]RUR28669.1 glycosyltransferase family 2 protein [Halomonas andesensis]
MTNLTVCVFSFNRGRYLRNCVESIQRCIPNAAIVIFDDHSDDPETLEYLRLVESSCQVITPEKMGSIKHGGLYHNMNVALERFKESRLMCFLQDDTQVVRFVSTDELEEMKSLFEDNPTVGFIHPCFIRGIDLKKRPVIPLMAPTPDFFYREDFGQSAGIHYSDLVVFKPDRLIEAGWDFQQSEPENDKQAKRMFGMMAYMWRPFAMWLPEVPAYRGKKKTLGLRLAERKKKVGFYPFKILTLNEVELVEEQMSPRLPVAEDFLECFPFSPPFPWTYNPLTGLRFLKHVNNFEVAIRRWFRR